MSALPRLAGVASTSRAVEARPIAPWPSWPSRSLPTPRASPSGRHDLQSFGATRAARESGHGAAGAVRVRATAGGGENEDAGAVLEMEQGRLNAVYNGRLGLGKLEFGDADEEEEAVLETLTRGRIGQRSTHRSQEQRPKAARLSMEWRIQRERYGICVGQVVAGRVVRLRPDGARIQLLPGGSQDALGAFGSAWLPLNQAPKPLRMAAGEEASRSPEELFGLLRVGQVRLFVVRSVPALDGVGAWHVGGEARKERARDAEAREEEEAPSSDESPPLPRPPRRRYDPIVSALAYDRRMQLRRTRQLLWATRNLRQNVTVAVEHVTPAGLRSTINSLPLFVPASTLDLGRVLEEHREALREEGASGAGEEDAEGAEEDAKSTIDGPPRSPLPQSAALSA
ncbi:hypothetical protein H632_c523p0, partial [Helicosporidium sp. ATCC 50920]